METWAGRGREALPNGLLRKASLKVTEGLFGDVELDPPETDCFQPLFRLDEELDEESEAEAR